MLVLCGSATSMMYREALSASSPLYGRRTGQWLLEPLRFKDLARFFPHLRGRDKLRMWALVGGVPHYARLASAKNGFEEALRDLVLSKDGPLFAEARYLLQEEITAQSVYWSLLHAMGSGITRISELGSRLGLPAGQLTKYLGVLRDLRLVERDLPVTEPDAAKSKRGTYQVTDPFLRLWFGCVAPFESHLELDRIALARRLMQPALDAHLAWCFERVCRQHVEGLAGDLSAVKVGRYWDRSLEIDVVALDERGRPVLAGECKWSSRPVGPRVLESLQAEVRSLWPDRASKIELALFSPSGFSPELTSAARKGKLRLVRWPI